MSYLQSHFDRVTKNGQDKNQDDDNDVDFREVVKMIMKTEKTIDKGKALQSGIKNEMGKASTAEQKKDEYKVTVKWREEQAKIKDIVKSRDRFKGEDQCFKPLFKTEQDESFQVNQWLDFLNGEPQEPQRPKKTNQVG